MNPPPLTQLGDELYQALQSRSAIAPLTSRGFDLSLDDAYRIQQRFLERRLAAGDQVIGKKIGLTSAAVMTMLGVNQPDFGQLLASMLYHDGEQVDTASLIAPRAEGEIAFILKKDKWSLAPAYDLAYSYKPGSKWVNSHWMSLNGKRDNFARSDFYSLEKLSPVFNKKKIDDIIDATIEHVSTWRQLAGEWDVPKTLIDEIQENLRLDI